MMGFFCRWAILALVWLCVGMLALGAIAAGKAIEGDLYAGYIMPDAMWGFSQIKNVHLTGYASIRLPTWTSSMFIARQAREPINTVWQSGNKVYLPLVRPRVGMNTIMVRGNPYGPYAFQSYRAVAMVVDFGRVPILLDARLALDVRGKNVSAFDSLAEQLRQRGDLALFHPGPLDRYVYDRRLLAWFAPDLPLVFATKDEPDAMQTLWDTAAHFRAKLVVITSDAELAQRAAGDQNRRFIVHLVSAVAIGDTGLYGRIRMHRSVGDLQQYMQNNNLDK